MRVAIEGFALDEAGVWVAQLACGHHQHVRHAPPWQERAWVTTASGRDSQRGALLECHACEMGQIPGDCAAYQRTKTFTEETVPHALTHDHQTKAGVWGRIVIEFGTLEYQCARGVFLLLPGIAGIVEPSKPHAGRVVGPVRFHVEFLRA